MFINLKRATMCSAELGTDWMFMNSKRAAILSAQDSWLPALLIVHSSGPSGPGAFHYALSKILSSQHFSLCIHQDSQLLALVIMHSARFSAGALG